MKFKLVIKPSAEVDISKIVSWYKSKKKDLANLFLEQVEVRMNLIQENPNIYQKKYEEVRVGLLRKFPFGIFYVTEEQTIYVIAVLHTSRNPMIWKTRA